MKCIFFLSGDYADIGSEEINSLFGVKSYKLGGRLAIADLNYDEKTIKRLALTKSVYKFLFECKSKDLIKSMKEFDWSSAYKDDFCVRLYDFNNGNTMTKKYINEKGNKNKIKISEKALAGHIWRSLKNPKVSLESPTTSIQLFIAEDRAYCGLLIYENKEDFESRRSHLRPFPHPSSLHPKVARALVNLTEIRENETLLDPFCGTGGFLIEAGLMKIKAVGYDINKMMADGCAENLKHFKIKNCKIRNKNAVSIGDKFDHAVTDLPYGLNSNAMSAYEKDWKKHRINKKTGTRHFIKSLGQFYLRFLKSLRKKLRKKAVIVFPSYVNYRKLLKQSGFRIEKEFSNYVHRSLTRKIVKIE